MIYLTTMFFNDVYSKYTRENEIKEEIGETIA